MVERYKRGNGKRKLLGSHQKCWIWGRHVVAETLRAGRWTLHDDLPEVTIAHLGYDAGTIGAAGLAWLAA